MSQTQVSRIPFNQPPRAGDEIRYIEEALANHHISGDGPFTKKCERWLEERVGCGRALLTHSCTAALEMAALVLDIKPGDEVIMPSFTFVSTANAFALRGAIPVFVDVREDTLNLDERKIEAAIGPRTRAIAPVHYAGVGCEMDVICDLAQRHGLAIVEDAAQGLLATYRGRPLGAFDRFGALSFHETKNVISGEGGALLLSDPQAIERAEIAREKGTNRSQFFRGMVDKYRWIDLGSSYMPSDIIAAFLWAQLQKAELLTARRLEAWNRYHDAFVDLERRGRARRPIIPPHCIHNGHLYYLLCPTSEQRTALLAMAREHAIDMIFHYVPLHSSPGGRRFGRACGELLVTDSVADRLVRLPLWPGISESVIDRVIEVVNKSLSA